MKRTFDLLAASVGLVVLSPVIALLIAIIRATSPGPGLFAQWRVGRDARPFRCYKLRTMQAGTPSVPTHEAAASHITRVGAFLRRTKLDELPQLWNVVKGEMSFVGPRPCLPSQSELIEERRKRGVLRARPGITGLSQLRGIDMSTPARLAKSDADYLQTATFAGDIGILLRTVFTGKGSGDRVRR